MTVKLNTIADNKGARKRKMIIGRGIGSSKGKTSGRGGKGQTARTGVAIKGFEGGQTPLHRRLPKRGFNNFNRTEFEVVNTGSIQKCIEAGSLDAKKPINAEALANAGLVKQDLAGIKLLAKGELKTGITIEICRASASAVKAVEKAGGKVTVTNPKVKAEAKADKPKKAKKAAETEE
jgi:large subunit ribosomal protein L15